MKAMMKQKRVILLSILLGLLFFGFASTQLFAKAESELKYSTLPRVIFEAALFKASMPQTDTDSSLRMVLSVRSKRKTARIPSHSLSVKWQFSI